MASKEKFCYASRLCDSIFIILVMNNLSRSWFFSKKEKVVLFPSVRAPAVEPSLSCFCGWSNFAVVAFVLIARDKLDLKNKNFEFGDCDHRVVHFFSDDSTDPIFWGVSCFVIQNTFFQIALAQRNIIAFKSILWID